MKDYVHHSNTHGFTGWFAQWSSTQRSETYQNVLTDFDEYYASGITGPGSGFPVGSAVTGNGQYSKMSFMHDYILGQKDDEGQVTENGPTAKLRMAFWPYAVMGSHKGAGNPRYANAIYWACAVECFDVLDRGAAYVKGQTFTMTWPPRQKQIDKYQNANSPNASTPTILGIVMSSLNITFLIESKQEQLATMPMTGMMIPIPLRRSSTRSLTTGTQTYGSSVNQTESWTVLNSKLKLRRSNE